MCQRIPWPNTSERENDIANIDKHQRNFDFAFAFALNLCEWLFRIDDLWTVCLLIGLRLMKHTDQGHLPVQSPLIPYKVVLIGESLNYNTKWRLHYMLLWGQRTCPFSCGNRRGLVPGTKDNHILSGLRIKSPLGVLVSCHRLYLFAERRKPEVIVLANKMI